MTVRGERLEAAFKWILKNESDFDRWRERKSHNKAWRAFTRKPRRISEKLHHVQTRNFFPTWTPGTEAVKPRVGNRGDCTPQAGLQHRNSKCSPQVPGPLILPHFITHVPLTICSPQYSSALVHGSDFTVPKAGLR